VDGAGVAGTRGRVATGPAVTDEGRVGVEQAVRLLRRPPQHCGGVALALEDGEGCREPVGEGALRCQLGAQPPAPAARAHERGRERRSSPGERRERHDGDRPPRGRERGRGEGARRAGGDGGRERQPVSR
jgi:hypothetical protein